MNNNNNGLGWIKSSFSPTNSQCVEFARDGDDFFIRDSKNPDGERLTFNRGEVEAFLKGAANGDFDKLLNG